MQIIPQLLDAGKEVGDRLRQPLGITVKRGVIEAHRPQVGKLRGAFPRAGDDGGSHLPLHHLQEGARLNQSNLAVILKHDLIAGMAFQLGEDMDCLLYTSRCV